VSIPTATAPAADAPRAYAWALGAILLWGTLAAAIGDALRGLPSGTVLVWTLGIAAVTLAALDLASGVRPRVASGRALALGVWGILGYHLAFFVALEQAPVVEANLLNYLWPLFMVLFAPAIVGERLTRGVIAGAVIGFAGAFVVVSGDVAPAREHVIGYALAAFAALAWATFSLGLKRVEAGPGALTCFVAASALLAIPVAALKDGVACLAPPGGRALVAIVWTGVGPLALGFHCWQKAMTLGSASRIGALSYIDPLLSTLAVAWWLEKPLGPRAWVGMALIVAGALLASYRRKPAA
jgi:drug/metabolite transporter (DMT)-like permease